MNNFCWWQWPCLSLSLKVITDFASHLILTNQNLCILYLILHGKSECKNVRFMLYLWLCNLNCNLVFFFVTTNASQLLLLLLFRSFFFDLHSTLIFLLLPRMIDFYIFTPPSNLYHFNEFNLKLNHYINKITSHSFFNKSQIMLDVIISFVFFRVCYIFCWCTRMPSAN